MAAVFLLAAPLVTLVVGQASDSLCLLQKGFAEKDELSNHPSHAPLSESWLRFENLSLAEGQHALLMAGRTKPQGHEQATAFMDVNPSLQLLPPYIDHVPEATNQEGKKNLVKTKHLRNTQGCVAYAAGIATDSRFEEELANSGCEVHAFDCTVDEKAKSVHSKHFTFHKWCLGKPTSDNAMTLSESTAYAKDDAESYEFKTLEATMAELGHSSLDLLKFDIEGFEWALFRDSLLSSPHLPLQLSFELHTAGANPNYVPEDLVKDKRRKEVDDLFLSLYDKGYRVVSKELNPTGLWRPSGFWDPRDGSHIPALGPEIDLKTAKALLFPVDSIVKDAFSLLGVAFPVAPADLAVTYVAGRPDYIPAIEKYIKPHAPSLHISRSDGKIPNNFVLALQESVDKFPDAKWYYVCDDDNFVVFDRLRHVAETLDPSQDHYVGKHHGGNSATGGGWVCGGPGVLISRPLAHRMRAGGCTRTHLDCIAGDIKIAHCASDAMPGFHVDDQAGFIVTHVGTAVPQGVIALHHISPATFEALGRYAEANNI